MAEEAKLFKSPSFQSAHELATALHKDGSISKKTMRTFDKHCLTKVPKLNPSDIREIRNSTGLSQAAFAEAINVATITVSKWEQGVKKPNGPSLKLLALVKAKGVDFLK